MSNRPVLPQNRQQTQFSTAIKTELNTGSPCLCNNSLLLTYNSTGQKKSGQSLDSSERTRVIKDVVASR